MRPSTRKFFDPVRLLEGLEVMVRPRTQIKGLELNLEIHPSVPDQLWTDQGKVRQILINLLDNAVKFTESGSVTIRAHAEGTDDSEKRLVVEVEDTGLGIADDKFDELFEEFRQLGGESPSQPGAGLGMAISRRFARMMGGDHTVTSQLGKGSVFHLEIPMEAPE